MFVRLSSITAVLFLVYARGARLRKKPFQKNVFCMEFAYTTPVVVNVNDVIRVADTRLIRIITANDGFSCSSAPVVVVIDRTDFPCRPCKQNRFIFGFVISMRPGYTYLSGCTYDTARPC